MEKKTQKTVFGTESKESVLSVETNHSTVECVKSKKEKKDSYSLPYTFYTKGESISYNNR